MREYIVEHGSVSEAEALQMAESYLRSGSAVYAVHTNRFYCGNDLEPDMQHLTELRIFDENSEFRMVRFGIGKDFAWRYIDDAEFRRRLTEESDVFLSGFRNRIFDEIQYLDIDTTVNQTDAYHYTTTGGGAFTLPVADAERLVIRCYLDYDAYGILAVNDFRLVKILKKGEQYERNSENMD